jgi:hypothetical protein
MADNNFLKDNQSLIIGGVILYFGYSKIIKPFLETLGLKKSDEEVIIDKEVTKVTSPWNPNYWKTIPNAKILTNADAIAKTDAIWNSVGWFNDDFEKVLGVFKTIQYKSQVSYLVYKFNQIYKKDLLIWLLGDIYPSDRYSAQQVNQLIELVKNYKTN